MKSPWIWIVVVIIALWIFSDNRGDKTRKAIQYQPQQTYQHPAMSAYSSPAFMGNPCTGDCSGHEAGYEWAEENGIDDPDDCDGNSNSFIEGCQSYAEEQQAEAEGQIR